MGYQDCLTCNMVSLKPSTRIRPSGDKRQPRFRQMVQAPLRTASYVARSRHPSSIYVRDSCMPWMVSLAQCAGQVDLL